MIPRDDLRLYRYEESHGGERLQEVAVTIGDAESTREFHAFFVDHDGGLQFSRFEDSAHDALTRSALPALFRAFDELADRGLDADLGPLAASAGHAVSEPPATEAETDEEATDTDTDTPDTDAEAPQSTAAVGDGGAVAPEPATSVVHGKALRVPLQHDPGRIPPVETQGTAADAGEDAPGDADLVDACPNCDGTGQVNERVTKPDEKRWKCYACSTTFPEPTRRPRKDTSAAADDEDTPPTCGTCGYVAKSEADLRRHQTSQQCFAGPTPPWLSRNPHDILDDSETTRDLRQVITAVRNADDVLGVTQRLALTDTDKSRGQVLQPLGVLAHNGKLIAGDTLDERLDVLEEWVDDE